MQRSDRIIIAGLRGLREWLELPGDGRPGAAALALRIEAQGGGRRVNHRRLATILAAAGIHASRRMGVWGYDRQELLTAIAPGGVLEELETAGRAADGADAGEES